MSNFLFYLAAFAVVLGVLIVVHEFGHYAVARLCGVRVLRFSIGFGRPLVSVVLGRDRTEWAMGAFPLGGYVKMLDEREGEVAPEERHRAFNTQPVGKRMAIVAAGPAANLLLAVLVYWLLFFSGTEELRPILGAPPAATAAAAAGIQNGEVVLKVAGRPVATWQELRWELLQYAVSGGDASIIGDRNPAPLPLEVMDSRQQISVRQLDLSSLGADGYEGDPLGRLGVLFYRPQIAPVLGSVAAGSVAEQAGLQPGDRIVAIDGEAVALWPEVVQKIRSAAGKSLRISLLRGDVPFAVQLMPEAYEDRGVRIGRIGIGVKDSGLTRADLMITVRYGLVTSLLKAVAETWDKASFSLVMMGKMLTGEVSWKNLSGPVTIADYAGQSARMGMDYYLKFLALVSISLGVLNLLPIPVLDGGHLMYYIIEIIKRGPVSERVMEVGQQIGLALLLLLMAFAFYNDINRLISS
ncbi:MAG TPA: RIP metalloprotease RseP [Azospira sp.]|nr:RIP metalloprotease RseP [Azospira sp.]